MEALFLIGRIIAGLFFLDAARNHFFNLEAVSGYAGSKNIPQPRLAVIVTGILLLAGGLSILTGIVPVLGIVCVAVFLVGVSFKMHAYWKVPDPMARIGERVNFTKNLALLGYTLMLLAIPRPWPLSLG